MNAGVSTDTVKESNPKDLIGALKIPHHLVPKTVMAEVAIGMAEGAIKYGAHNYRAIGVRASIYTSATRRHLDRFEEGEDLDPDSRALLSHITKAICSLTVLRDAMIQDKWVDDRPPKTPDIDAFMRDLDAKMVALSEQYPDPKPPYTELDVYGALK